jgi:hypothetical protein
MIIYLVFGASNLVIDLLMFAYIFGVVVFDAATLPGKIQNGYWMMAAVDLVFDLIMMIVRVFIILVNIVGKIKG